VVKVDAGAKTRRYSECCYWADAWRTLTPELEWEP